MALCIGAGGAMVLAAAVAYVGIALLAVTGMTLVGEMNTDDAVTLLAACATAAASAFFYLGHRLPLRRFLAHRALLAHFGFGMSLVLFFPAVRFSVYFIEQQHERLPSPSARSFWVALVMTVIFAILVRPRKSKPAPPRDSMRAA